MFSLHKIPVSVLFIFLFSSASGSDPYFLAAGAAEAGMSYSCVMRTRILVIISQPGIASVQYSQLLLDSITRTDSILASLEPDQRDLSFLPGRQCIGAIYNHFGYKDLTRHSAGLACGLKLSEKISAGIQTDFFSEKTAGEYNERRSLTFEAGFLDNSF